MAIVNAPAERSHAVARGDTLYGIARRYSTTPGELARLNDLAPPFAIQQGQVLRLPASRAGRVTTQADAAPVTFVRDEQKVGRNDPCPCGSGKKYKHCHGQLT